MIKELSKKRMQIDKKFKRIRHEWKNVIITNNPKTMEAKLIWYEKKSGKTNAGDYLDAIFFLNDEYRGNRLLTVRVYECYHYSEHKIKELLDQWYLLDFSEHRENGEVQCYVLNELKTIEKQYKRVTA